MDERITRFCGHSRGIGANQAFGYSVLLDQAAMSCAAAGGYFARTMMPCTWGTGHCDRLSIEMLMHSPPHPRLTQANC
jgi:hypothetical protein